MGAPSTDKVRNVVLLGHGDAGKTSLAEAMLFMAGQTKRLGSVAEGHSNLDYEAEEVKRKITLNLALAPLEHNGVKVNIIDTPGYADFIGDAIAGMEAAEMALFVVDAVAGPQVQTRKLWKLATEMGIAKAIFINRMDKEHADFAAAMKSLEEAFGHRVGAVQIPLGAEEDFRGVIDIIRMKAYHHEEDKEQVLEIPADLKDAAESARDKLCELVAEADDDLMMKYLEGERLTQEELETLLDKAIAQSTFIPVFVGSATAMQGVEDLLDDIVTFFPEPTAHGPLTTVDGSEMHITTGGEVAAHVFKTLSDPYVGRMNFVKVVSGTLKPGDELVNSRTGKKERVAHVYKMTGKETTDIEAAPAGDIAVLTKLSDTLTNDTLSAKGDVAFAPLPLPEPLYPVAIVAKTKADEDKLGSALKSIVEEDPSLILRRDEETHQTVITSYGDAAIDVLLNRLHDRFHVEAELVDIRIPYRETIRKTAQAQGRHKKQTGGSGQFADCWLRLEPNPGAGYEFLDEIVGGRISKPFIVAIDKGVQDTMTSGAIAGYPVVDVKVAVYDGSMHSVDSNEMAFKTAARIGFRAAAEKADPVILEPIATLSIEVPDEHAGAVMGDISSIRGRILGMDAPEAGVQVIHAQAPYAEVVHYSPHLRSITSGTGTYTLSIESYEQVPGDVQKKLVEEYQKEKAEGH
ncbi:elongation factor G [Anaerosoma tenue]|uniref:elongation factor G n=1 Tax=Anaerosoma tenue TaxID=2933588 RepID=UPI0022610349|nr:elongation factor G [Anaerosoma tenue]MCK8114007.1 elongation factor G [Anaerosoma tenue]